MEINNLVESIVSQLFGPLVDNYSTSRTKLQRKTIDFVCELMSGETGCSIRFVNDVVFINDVPWSITSEGDCMWLTVFGRYDTYYEASVDIIDKSTLTSTTSEE